MWRIFNKLFEWDYVVILRKVLNEYKIVRVLQYHNNSALKIFGQYKNIDEEKIVTWLTCKPEKYLK